jgi:hypothetical protein
MIKKREAKTRETEAEAATADDTNNFSMYEGEDAEPYYPILNSAGDPIDLSSASEIVFVAAPTGTSTEAIITLHLSDPETQVMIDYDPDDPEATIRNTIFVNLKPTDTDGHVGIFHHEVAIELTGRRTVVFPVVVGALQTFTVVKSYTWDETTHGSMLKKEKRQIRVATGNNKGFNGTRGPSVRSNAEGRA